MPTNNSLNILKSFAPFTESNYLRQLETMYASASSFHTKNLTFFKSDIPKLHLFLQILNNIKSLHESNLLPAGIKASLVDQFPEILTLDYISCEVRAYSIHNDNYIFFRAKKSEELPKEEHYFRDRYLSEELLTKPESTKGLVCINDESIYLNIKKADLQKLIDNEDAEEIGYLNNFHLYVLLNYNNPTSQYHKLNETCDNLSAEGLLTQLFPNKPQIIELFELFDAGIYSDLYFEHSFLQTISRATYLTNKHKTPVSKKLIKGLLNKFSHLEIYYKQYPEETEALYKLFEVIINQSSEKELNSFFTKLAKVETQQGPFSLVDSFNFSFFDRIEEIFQRNINKLPAFVKTDFLSVSKYLTNNPAKASHTAPKNYPFEQPEDIVAFQISTDKLKPNFSFPIDSFNFGVLLNIMFKEFKSQKIISSASISKGKNKTRNIYYVSLEKGKLFTDNTLGDMAKFYLHLISSINAEQSLQFSINATNELQVKTSRIYREYSLKNQLSDDNKNTHVKHKI